MVILRFLDFILRVVCVIEEFLVGYDMILFGLEKIILIVVCKIDWRGKSGYSKLVDFYYYKFVLGGGMGWG